MSSHNSTLPSSNISFSNTTYNYTIDASESITHNMSMSTEASVPLQNSTSASQNSTMTTTEATVRKKEIFDANKWPWNHWTKIYVTKYKIKSNSSNINKNKLQKSDFLQTKIIRKQQKTPKILPEVKHTTLSKTSANIKDSTTTMTTGLVTSLDYSSDTTPSAVPLDRLISTDSTRHAKEQNKIIGKLRKNTRSNITQLDEREAYSIINNTSLYKTTSLKTYKTTQKNKRLINILPVDHPMTSVVNQLQENKKLRNQTKVQNRNKHTRTKQTTDSKSSSVKPTTMEVLMEKSEVVTKRYEEHHEVSRGTLGTTTTYFMNQLLQTIDVDKDELMIQSGKELRGETNWYNNTRHLTYLNSAGKNASHTSVNVISSTG